MNLYSQGLLYEFFCPFLWPLLCLVSNVGPESPALQGRALYICHADSLVAVLIPPQTLGPPGRFSYYPLREILWVLISAHHCPSIFTVTLLSLQ